MPKDTTGDSIERENDNLNEPGTYLLYVTEGEEPPTKKRGADKGTMISGGLFGMTCQVVCGIPKTEGVPPQDNKFCDITIYGDDPGAKENARAMGRRRRDQLYLALNKTPVSAIVAKEDGKIGLTPGATVEFDANHDIAGQLFWATFDAMSEAAPGKRSYLKTDWLEARHIDDPAAASWLKVCGQKAKDAYALVPPANRWVDGRPRGVAAPAKSAPKQPAKAAASEAL